ncbi:MAG: hypothetical protein M1826_000639 [Phylliscum demangeonii]|nr:MAG: hypothetical protein M1826_000639 [Phylliscum demangeonii]
MAVWPFGRSQPERGSTESATGYTSALASDVVKERRDRSRIDDDDDRPRIMPTTTDERLVARHDYEPAPIGMATTYLSLHDTASPEASARDDIPSYYFLNPTSSTSLASDGHRSWPKPPTLRSKRSANDSTLVRRRSSKKKKQEHGRELSSSPAAGAAAAAAVVTAGARDRPATDSSGPLGRMSTDARPRSDRDLPRRTLLRPRSTRRQRPLSTVYPDDWDMGLSPVPDDVDQAAYMVRTLGMLSPRPTIHCRDSLRSLAAAPAPAPSRSTSKAERGRPAITDEAMKESQTVDELADKLDSGGIRELMERDQRRRERKQKADAARLQRKLERRAEKQRREEEEEQWAARRTVDERPVFGRTPTGFGVDVAMGEPSAAAGPAEVSRDSRQDDANDSPLSWLQDPSQERLQPRAVTSDGRPPLPDVHLEDATPIEEAEEAILGTAQAVRLSQASMSPPTSPRAVVRPTSNISQITEPLLAASPPPPPTRVSISDRAPSNPRASASSVRAGSSGAWASFFRRSGVRSSRRDSADAGRRTPSEFSNTSRDSLPPRPLPPLSSASPSARNSRVQRRSGPSVRTTSKFREALPELSLPPPAAAMSLSPPPPPPLPLPLSPPDSRWQSPDLNLSQPGSSPMDVGRRAGGGVVAPPPDRMSDEDASFHVPGTAGHARDTAGSPTATGLDSRGAAFVQRQRSVGARSIEGGPAASAVVSPSMASIDSEGSWLSGRRAARGSQAAPPALDGRHSASSLPRRFHDFSDSGEAEGEELGLSEDEYFSQLAPAPDETDRRRHGRGHGHLRKSSGAAIASSESEGEGEGDGEGVGVEDDEDRPSVVEQQRWHGGVARQPTVVHHATRAQSREGLLNEYAEHEHEQDPDPEPEEEEEEEEEEEAPTAAAADVVVQGTHQHVRHISAGSARLLEIAPRSSTDQRLSVGSSVSKGGSSVGGSVAVPRLEE